MNIVRKIIGIAYKDIAFIKSQWMWLAQSAVISIGWMLMLSSWGGINALKNMVAVYIAVSGWGLGLNLIAQFVGWDKISKEWERMIASPISLGEYFLGVTLAMEPYNLLAIVISTTVAFFIGINIMKTLVAFLVVNTLSTVLGAALSLSIILRIKKPTNISAITNPLQSLTTFLPPVYYLPSVLPPIARDISIGIPTVALVDLARYIIGIDYYFNPLVSTTSILIWLIAVGILTAKVLKWGLE
ncbi:MAG: ABC transporter permease [Ignisphaera sp.]